MKTENYLSAVYRAVTIGKAKKATAYIGPNLTVKATFQGDRRYKHRNGFTVLVTTGKPNYEEREFIRLAKKAKEPFPIKKIQLKFEKRV